MGAYISVPNTQQKKPATHPIAQALCQAACDNDHRHALNIITNMDRQKLDLRYTGTLKIEQTHKTYHYYVATTTNIFSIVEKFYDTYDFDISKYIIKDNNTWYIKLENINVIWLVMLYSMFDHVLFTNWFDVFTELISVTNFSIDDKIFKMPAYQVVLCTRYLRPYFGELLKHSQKPLSLASTIKIKDNSYNIVQYLTLTNSLLLLTELLENTNASEHLSKTNILHFVEDCDIDRPKYIELLIKHGANIYYTSTFTRKYCFEEAIKKRNFKSATYYFQNFDIITKHPKIVSQIVTDILTICVRTYYLMGVDMYKDLLQVIVAQAIKENCTALFTTQHKGTYPIIQASCCHEDILQMFLTAQRELKLNLLDQKNEAGQTALLNACKLRLIKNVRLILYHASLLKLNITNQIDNLGNNCLMTCMYQDNITLILLFLNDVNTDLTHTNKAGENFLHIACRYRPTKLVKVLMTVIDKKKKTDIYNTKNTGEQTPIMIAHANNRTKIIRYFVKRNMRKS
jgi:ankyrin repeat protein